MLIAYHKEYIVCQKKREDIIIKLKDVSAEPGKMNIHKNDVLFLGRVSEKDFRFTPTAKLNYGIHNGLVPEIYGKFVDQEENNKNIMEVTVKGTAIYWAAFLIVSLVFINALLQGNNPFSCVFVYILAICFFILSFTIPCSRAVEEIKRLIS